MAIRVKTDGVNILAIGEDTDDFGELLAGQMLVDVTNETVPADAFTHWQVDGDQLVLRATAMPEAAARALREPGGLFKLLEDRLHEYIFAHYDPYTQASLQSLYVDPRTPPAAKDAITAAWDWVRSVLDYYYQQKARLEAGEAGQVFLELNFTQFDTTDPGVTLRALINPD